MANRFHKKVAVVTGGGAGMGEAAAKAFAAEGAAVVLAEIDNQRAAHVSESIRETGGEALSIQTDVSRASDVNAMVNEAVERYGGIDILFNNAGIQTYGTVEEMPEDEFDRVLAVNFKAMFLTAKYVIPEMRRRGGGAIINNASVQALASQTGVSAYAATKGAVLSFTRALACDHGHENIRVNSILPGGVETPMLRASAEKFGAGKDPVELFKSWGEPYPVGRLGKPEEVAKLVLFLASEDASFCTGAAFVVDGGILATLAAGL